MKSRAGLVLLLLLPFLSACAHIEPALQAGRLKDRLGNPSSGRYVRTRGIGAVPEGLKSRSQRRAASREAAIIAARREMLAYIGGVRITGQITIKQAMLVDSELHARVDDLVAGAEVALVEWGDDDFAVVTLEIRRREVRKLRKGIRAEDLPPPLPEPSRELWRSEKAREDARPRKRPASAQPARSGLGPNDVLLIGLLFPGAGQIVAAGQMGETAAARRLRTRGIATMGAVLGIAGAAAVALESEPEETGTTSTGEPRTNKKDKQILGFGLLGLAGFVHCWGSMDARKTLKGNTLAVLPAPRGTGVQVAWVRRW